MAKKVIISDQMFGTRQRNQEKYTRQKNLDIVLWVIFDCNSKYFFSGRQPWQKSLISLPSFKIFPICFNVLKSQVLSHSATCKPALTQSFLY